MRNVLTYGLIALALFGLAAAVYALFQPNPTGDFLTGMAHLFISALGAAFAVFAAILAAVLMFTQLKIRWVIFGAAGFVGLTLAALQMI